MMGLVIGRLNQKLFKNTLKKPLVYFIYKKNTEQLMLGLSVSCLFIGDAWSCHKQKLNPL